MPRMSATPQVWLRISRPRRRANSQRRRVALVGRGGEVLRGVELDADHPRAAGELLEAREAGLGGVVRVVGEVDRQAPRVGGRGLARAEVADAEVGTDAQAVGHARGAHAQLVHHRHGRLGPSRVRDVLVGERADVAVTVHDADAGRLAGQEPPGVRRFSLHRRCPPPAGAGSRPRSPAGRRPRSPRSGSGRPRRRGSGTAPRCRRRAARAPKRRTTSSMPRNGRYFAVSTLRFGNRSSSAYRTRSMA